MMITLDTIDGESIAWMKVEWRSFGQAIDGDGDGRISNDKCEQISIKSDQFRKLATKSRRFG
jgi:hypothetical protein